VIRGRWWMQVAEAAVLVEMEVSPDPHHYHHHHRRR
jgi:hypothetical protein